MKKRSLILVLAAAFVSEAGTATLQAGQQAAAAPRPQARALTPAKTPWGDPDPQGNYNNKYEYGTPFERPQEFEGRRLEDVTPGELADVVKKRQQDTLEGAKFFGGDPEGNIGNSAEFRDIYEVSRGSRAWLVVDPPDGKIPPLKPEAGARSARQPGAAGLNGPEDFSLWTRCITRGFPGSMIPGVYGNSYQIMQAPGVVVIRYEMVHDTRIIRLDGAPHPGSHIRLDMGDARGRWEGNTLVVETTNLKQRSAYRNANASTLRVVERFTPTARDTLDWAVTVDDPSTWTRPWTFSIPLTMNNAEAIELYECHEGNRGVSSILSGARATERAETTRRD